MRGRAGLEDERHIQGNDGMAGMISFVANGNVTGLLAGLSLTPLGAVLACAVKPYFALAVVLHAAFWFASRRRHSAVCRVAER